MAEAGITLVAVLVGYFLGRMHTEPITAVLKNGRFTVGKTFPVFAEKAEFIMPNRVEEILKENPAATLDDMLI